jgi:hypothetical protein
MAVGGELHVTAALPLAPIDLLTGCTEQGSRSEDENRLPSHYWESKRSCPARSFVTVPN